MLLAGCLEAAEPFPLSDSDPDSPGFQRRFMASYGVNGAIEPTLSSRDRQVYARVLPLLADRPQEAIREIQQSLEPDSGPALHFLLGNLHFQAREYAASKRALGRSLEAFPDFRRAWRTLAFCQVQLGEFAESIPTWLKVITLGGGDAQSYGLLGYAYLLEGKHESGLSAYRMARMFSPDSSDFRLGQAVCLLETHQPQAAIALLEELIGEQPEVAVFWMKQAEGHRAEGNRQEAIVNLEVAAGMGGASWNAKMQLGELYLAEETPHRALAVYQEALRERRPASWDDLLKPLHQLLGQRLFPEARDYLAQVREGSLPASTPRSESRLKLAEARIEMELGDTGEAAAILLGLVEIDPLNGEALRILGNYYEVQDDPDRAMIYYGRAAMVPEFEYKALLDQGRIAVNQGNLEEAREFYRRAEAIKSTPGVRRRLDAIGERLRASP